MTARRRARQWSLVIQTVPNVPETASAHSTDTNVPNVPYARRAQRTLSLSLSLETSLCAPRAQGTVGTLLAAGRAGATFLPRCSGSVAGRRAVAHPGVP
jgi:hypothetical protein